MTFVIGFRCSDGIVLCADQLESNGVTKRHRCKIYSMSMDAEWGVCWATSAYGDVSDKFTDKLKNSLQRLREYKQEDIEQAAESALALMHRDDPNFVLQVIMGAWSAPIVSGSRLETAKTILYRGRSDVQVLAVEQDYAVCGADTTLSEFILRNTFEYMQISVDQGIRLGFFVTAMMKNYAEGVGGPIDVVSHRNTERNWHAPNPQELAAIESKMNVNELEQVLKRWWKQKNNDLPSSET